ncbi:hypothetical protein LWI29_002686 [Acer saccharum]|uniref:Uncharacterized protein n=1 Tax=Acer saccharum TaxID=4024 RepID=A0AA39S8S6_ACESA|nr:hypothetical protein LWI29_002686 [Acer saccharum]
MLATYGLAELRIGGDGNCQISWFRNPDYHKHVRKEIIKQFGANICLVTSFRDTCFIGIMPKDKNPTRSRYHTHVLYVPFPPRFLRNEPLDSSIFA